MSKNPLVHAKNERNRVALARLLRKRKSHEVGIMDTSIIRSFSKQSLQEDHGIYTLSELWAIETDTKRAIFESLEDGMSVPQEVYDEYKSPHKGLRNRRLHPYRALCMWWNEDLPALEIEVKQETREENRNARSELARFIEQGYTVQAALKALPSEAYMGTYSRYLPAITRAVSSLAPKPKQNERAERHSRDVSIFAKAGVISYQSDVCISTCDRGFFVLQERFYENLDKLVKEYDFPIPRHDVSVILMQGSKPWKQKPIRSAAA